MPVTIYVIEFGMKWSRAAGDFFTKLCVTCDEKKSDDEENNHEDVGVSRKNLDTGVKPSDNFFRYANGGWMDSNTIPAGYPTWNPFLHLHTLSQERLKEILESIESIKSEKSSNDTKLAAFLRRLWMKKVLKRMVQSL